MRSRPSGDGLESADWSLTVGLGRLGPALLLDVAWSLLLGRGRSLAEDAQRVVSLMDPPPRASGLQFVPPRDPFLLVANHFQTPDLWVGWVAAAISAEVARARDRRGRELHWVAISEWRWFELGGHWVPNPITTLLFRRAAKVWGMVPMSPRPSDVAARARALRQVLGYLGLRRDGQRAMPEPVALFPEGRATVALDDAKPGSGAFLYRVSQLGVPLLPVGACLEMGVLQISFGAPFLLGQSPMGRGEDVDRWARQKVMVAIARLLPRRLRGTYADALAEE